MRPTNDNNFPKILLIGECDYQELKNQVESSLGILFYQGNVSILDEIMDEKFVACIVTSETMQNYHRAELLMKRLQFIFPGLPIIAVFPRHPRNSTLQRFYDCGMIDYLMQDAGSECIAVVTKKLRTFLTIYTAEQLLEKEIQEKEDLLIAYVNDSNKYINILKASLTAFVILNKDGEILETNDIFSNLITIKKNSKAKTLSDAEIKANIGPVFDKYMSIQNSYWAVVAFRISITKCIRDRAV